MENSAFHFEFPTYPQPLLLRPPPPRPHLRYLLFNNRAIEAANNDAVQPQSAAVRGSCLPVAVGLTG